MAPITGRRVAIILSYLAVKIHVHTVYLYVMRKDDFVDWNNRIGRRSASAGEHNLDRTEHTEWLDETGGIPDATGWMDDTLPMETIEIPEIAAESLKTPSAEENNALPAADWVDESDGYPRLNPGEWDDTLDQEPEGWFCDVRVERYYPEEESGAEDSEQGESDQERAEKATELWGEMDSQMEGNLTEEGQLELIEEDEPDCGLQMDDPLPVLHFEDEDSRPVRGEEAIDYTEADYEESADCAKEHTEENIKEDTEEEIEEDTAREFHVGPLQINFVTLTAVALAGAIVAAMVTGVSTFSFNKKLQEQQTLLASVGDVLPGDQPLNTDAMQQLADLRIQAEEEQAAAEEAARKRAEEEAEQDAEEGSVAVEASLSTIQSDLKIKIRRQKEQSLIGGVPFKVKVKDPKGKVTEQSDTDEDGIIYLTGLSSGTYEVTLCQLIDLDSLKQQEDYRSNEDYLNYAKYKISEKSESIQVTDNITYEVVDVSDEVKSASEVNAAKEDTAKNDTPVESTIKDTVEWVESTKTEIDGSGDSSYIEVQKSDIPDPYASAALTDSRWTASQFHMLAEVTDGTLQSSQDGASDSPSSQESSEGNSAGDSSSENSASKEESTESGSENTSEGSPETASSAASSESASQGMSDSKSSSEGSSSGTSSDASSGSSGTSENSQGTDDGSKAQPQLKVDPSEIHLAEGKTQTIKATISDGANTTVTYSSSDSSIATVSDGGTVQGVKAGSCTITVSLKDYPDITQKVSVTISEKTNDSSPLKDSDGNPLYVKDGDSYRAATAADYSKYDTFYRMTSAEKKYKYTGWQHINGLTYYYDKNGDYVTGSQIIQGVSYTFSSEGILDTGSTNAGIDVSMWNGKINWNEVAASGIHFAIVRCGYRGSSTGTLVKDSSVGTNITGAKNAGLKVGLYFFSQAINEAEAVEEASMAVQIARSYGISMPIFLDVESSGGRGDSISTSQRTANIAAFCRTVQNAGYSAGVYANTNWFSEKINVSSLTSYHIWLAQYAASPTYSRSRYDIWQYSATGRVNGISGDVDLDISYRSY